MTLRRRKITEAEAAELLAAWRSSKRALPDWCAAHGVDGRSLRYWAGRLSAATSIRVMEVTMAVPSGPPSLRLSVEDLTIEVPDGFTAETLTRVLAVVRGC
jgi:hypothetical protein